MSVVIGASTPPPVHDEEYAVARYETANAMRQAAASCIDLAIILVSTAAVATLSMNIWATALFTVQLLVMLAVVEGSRGSSPGKLMLHLRTVRAETLNEPQEGTLPAGMRRIAGKYLLQILLCCTVVGIPVVVFSPCFANHNSRRGLPDRWARLACVDISSRSYVMLYKPRLYGDEGMELESRLHDELERRIEPSQLDAIIGTPAIPTIPASKPISNVVGNDIQAQQHVAPVLPLPKPLLQQAQSTVVPLPKSMSKTQPPVDRASRHAVALPPKPDEAIPSHEADNIRTVRKLSLQFADAPAIPLARHATIILGRKPHKIHAQDTLIEVPDTTGTVSRNHAVLEVDDEGIWITDCGSTNGTSTVSGGERNRLPANVRTSIQPGTEIVLGEVTCSIIQAHRKGRHA